MDCRCRFCGENAEPKYPGWHFANHPIHCESKICIGKCPDCQDDFEAIGASPPSEKPVLYKVHLDKGRMVEATTLAKMRQLTKDMFDIPGERFSGKDRSYEHTVGIACEYGFELLTGMPFDRSITKKGDGGIDFVTNKGVIDIKGSAYPDIMQVKVYDLGKETDIFVASHFVPSGDKKEADIEFKGWIEKSNVHKYPVVENGPMGKRHRIPCKELTNMGELVIGLYQTKREPRGER